MAITIIQLRNERLIYQGSNMRLRTIINYKILKLFTIKVIIIKIINY